MRKNTACYVFHASSAHTGAIDSESLSHIDHPVTTVTGRRNFHHELERKRNMNSKTRVRARPTRRALQSLADPTCFSHFTGGVC